jgi:hypothetical protein
MEILEHAFQQPRVALQAGAVDLALRFLRRRGEQVESTAAGNCRQSARLAWPGRLPLPFFGLALAAGAIGLAGSATATAGRDRAGRRPVVISGNSSRVRRGRGAEPRIAPKLVGRPLLSLPAGCPARASRRRARQGQDRHQRQPQRPFDRRIADQLTPASTP